MTLANAKPDLWITGPLGTSTVNAASSAFHDQTTLEQKITAAYAYALSVGAKYLYLPDCFEGYDPTLVTPQPGIILLTESQRSVNAVVSVRAYGAKGDGTTDDTAAIQSAHTAALASGAVRPVVWFPNGTYRISVGATWCLSINGGPVTWQGAPGAMLQLASGTTAAIEMLRINTAPGSAQLGGGAVKIIIDGLAFDTNNGQLAIGIRGLNTKDVVVRNCRFTNIGNNGSNAGGYGVKFEGVAAGPANPFVWAAAAPASFCQENKVLNCAFDGFAAGTPGQNYGTGILIYENDGALIHENTITSGIGVSVFGPNRRIVVDSNEIYDCGDVGIYCSIDSAGYGDNNRSREHVISNNVVRNCAGDSGIKCNGSRMTVRGNTCSYNANSGIKADHSSELAIIGNQCMNNTNRAIMLAKASLANEGSHDGATIEGNICIDDAADGIFVQGGGDTGASPATNITIIGNKLARNLLNGIRCDDCDSRLRIIGNVAVENGPAGGVGAGIFLRATNLNWGGATIAFNRCAGLVTGVAATAKQPCGIQFDAASGKTLSVCYSHVNDCSDSPNVTATSGIAICTQANRTGGGTVSGQYMRGTMYRNTTYGPVQTAIGIGIQTTDIVLREDESGLSIEFGPVFTGRRSTVLFQNAGLTSTSTVDASINFYSLPASTLNAAAQAIRITARGRMATQAGSFNVKFGATVLGTVAPLAGESWEWVGTLTRTGAATQLATGHTLHNATIASFAAQPAETLANALGIDFRGSVTSGGTLTVDYMMVEYVSS